MSKILTTEGLPLEESLKKVEQKNKFRALIFISCWISMEYLHLNWDLSWPWLTLGNVFANSTYFVQWYEFTGSTASTR